MSDLRLPPPDRDALPIFKEVGASVQVLVRLKNRPGIFTGHYMHSLGEWLIDRVHSARAGSISVVEWYPMPAPGSGTRCSE